MDRLLMVGEILLLIWLVVQGERLLSIDRDNWRMNKERYDERKKWREAKQKAVIKKAAQDEKPT